MDKYGLKNRYGSTGTKTRGMEGEFTSQGNTARDARRAAIREQRPATFAEMQESGQARPAPPAVAPVQSAPAIASPAPSPMATGASYFTGAPASVASQPTATPIAPQFQAANPLIGAPVAPVAPTLNRGAGISGGIKYVGDMRQYNKDLKAYEAAKSRYDRMAPLMQAFGNGQGVYDTMRQRALADLDAEFGARRASLEDTLARRGLLDSTGELGAGARYGDLEGQYGRARAGLEADLLAAEDQRQMQWLQAMTELARAFGVTGGI